MNERYFFRFFFFKAKDFILNAGVDETQFWRRIRRAHSKVVGYLFQDELVMIQSFFTRFQIRKKILDFWAFMDKTLLSAWKNDRASRKTNDIRVENIKLKVLWGLCSFTFHGL